MWPWPPAHLAQPSLLSESLAPLLAPPSPAAAYSDGAASQVPCAACLCVVLRLDWLFAEDRGSHVPFSPVKTERRPVTQKERQRCNCVIARQNLASTLNCVISLDTHSTQPAKSVAPEWLGPLSPRCLAHVRHWEVFIGCIKWSDLDTLYLVLCICPSLLSPILSVHPYIAFPSCQTLFQVL